MTPDTPAVSIARLKAAAGNHFEIIPLPVGGTTCITTNLRVTEIRPPTR